MMALLAPAPGERVLDVGCGPGFLLRDLAAAVGPAGHAEGVDPSEAMRGMAERRVADSGNAVVRAGTAEVLPYDDSSFDAVVLSQVLLYVPDVLAALHEVRRVLRPGGRLVVCDTDWGGLVVNTADEARFRRVHAACVTTFVHPYLPRRLPALLAAAGLPLGRVETVAMIAAGHAEDTFAGNWAFRVAPQKCRAAAVPEADIEGWLQEQRALDEGGELFVSLHRFLFLAHAP